MHLQRYAPRSCLSQCWLTLHYQIAAQDGTLTKSDQTTRLYLLAAIYCDISERKRAARNQDFVDLKDMMADLKIRLEATFALTKDQKVRLSCSLLAGIISLTLIQTNLRKTANDLIYQANRTRFVNMNLDVMVCAEKYTLLPSSSNQSHRSTSRTIQVI